jgi:mono/diheme cytochrome c family protein
MTMFPLRLLVAIIGSGCLLVGCGSSTPSTETAQADASLAEPAADASASEAGSAGQSVALTDIFPEAPAREAVLNSCGSCHAVACLALGQRSASRWNGLKESHRETVSNTAEELDEIFAYLQESFNEATPEPQIPPAFLAQGCTPF